MADSELEDVSTREAILAIVPKIGGLLSFCSSGCIAYYVISDRRRRAKTYHRLLAVMSVCDMVSSFAYFLSTWPVPQGQNLGWKKNSHIWAVGNAATCTAQAVGIQWGVTSAVLNVALSAHYLLVIRYKVTERQLKKYEPFIGIFALLIGLALTIPGILLGIYGNTNLWCWISPSFAQCSEEGLTRQECVDRAYRYRWSFYYGPLWACIILITITQAALLQHVFKVEEVSARWSKIHSSRQLQYRQTKQVAIQACWYVGVFYITWLPYTSIALTGKFFNPDESFGVLFLVVLFQPLQGFLNLFVYQRKLIFERFSMCWSHAKSTTFSTVRKSFNLNTKTKTNTTMVSKDFKDHEDDAIHPISAPKGRVIPNSSDDCDEASKDKEGGELKPLGSNPLDATPESNQDGEDVNQNKSENYRVGRIYED